MISNTPSSLTRFRNFLTSFSREHKLCKLFTVTRSKLGSDAKDYEDCYLHIATGGSNMFQWAKEMRQIVVQHPDIIEEHNKAIRAATLPDLPLVENTSKERKCLDELQELEAHEEFEAHEELEGEYGRQENDEADIENVSINPASMSETQLGADS